MYRVLQTEEAIEYITHTLEATPHTSVAIMRDVNCAIFLYKHPEGYLIRTSIKVGSELKHHITITDEEDKIKQIVYYNTFGSERLTDELLETAKKLLNPETISA